MQLGLTDYVWNIGDPVEAALHGTNAEPKGKRQGRCTIIGGGAM
jgi:hypothetical protein